jgi:tight adherence protein B
VRLPTQLRRAGKPTTASPIETSTAVVLDRLAVLLEAGVPPAIAWSHLAAVSPHPGFAHVARALSAGLPGAPAIAEAFAGESSAPEWRQTAATWSVAEETGAPLARSLRSAADSSRSVDQARRDAEVALSGPLATSRVVLVLPALGLLLGLALGLDTPAVLFTRPVGWVCLGGAAALVLIARRWNGRLVRSAAPSTSVPGLDLDLVATALGGGGSWANARRRVADSLELYCHDEHDPTPPEAVAILVRLSEEAGIPAASLLRSAADERRRDARAAAGKAAERLGVMLMLPLGVCILPAFLLVGVVPLFIALLSSTAARV